MPLDHLRAASATPGWRGWFIWGVGVTAYMLAVVNRSSLSAVGIDTAERFGADAATLSMFAVVQLAVYGGMQIPVGLLLDRYGARPIMAIGMLLMAVGQLTLAFSPSVGVAIFARVLLGAGDAAVLCRFAVLGRRGRWADVLNEYPITNKECPMSKFP